MDARTAQAGPSVTTGSGAAPRVVKVVKPAADQAVTLELGYTQSAKLDLSGVANEKMKFVHVGEKLIIVFDNNATVTVHPFFDSTGLPLQNITVEVAPGKAMASSEFVSTFPISGEDGGVRVVKVVKPDSDQAVTLELGYDQKVKLDLSGVANEKLTLVHIGEKLIILFDNQSTVTVHPFFDSMGVPLSNVSVIVSSGQDLPSGEFVSTVPISTDTTLLPTAGPGTAATEKSGAFFTDVPVDPLLLPNPLPLLPPEQLPGIVFTPEEPPVISGEPIIEPIPVNGLPSLGSNALAQLDDDALFGGIEGGQGDDPNAVNVTGILSHDYGSDGPGTTLLTAEGAVLPVGFTASVNAEGTVLTIHQVSTNLDVLQISLSNTTDGSYTVTQLNSVSHPAGGDENNLQFSINYVVTDGNGDSATGSFSIDVDDDTPNAVVIDTTAAAIVLDESPVAPGGDGIVSATADFSVNFAAVTAFGADGAGSVAYDLVLTGTGRAVRLVCAGCGGHRRRATATALARARRSCSTRMPAT